MGSQPNTLPQGEAWTIERAEALLNSLTGVLSARVVARPGGQIDEIHLLTTTEVEPKQTVRNVESALLARFDLTVDHRKISVAQTADPVEPEELEAAVTPLPLQALEPEDKEKPRIQLVGHQVSSERHQRVRTQVRLEWDGEIYEGEAVGADLPRARLEGLAHATLEAVLGAVTAATDDEDVHAGQLSLTLDGVKVVEAFDRGYALVGVHATDGRQTASLTGAAAVDQNTDRSVVLATLQATDRWVRGRIGE